jgi:hypothetical protein
VALTMLVAHWMFLVAGALSLTMDAYSPEPERPLLQPQVVPNTLLPPLVLMHGVKGSHLRKGTGCCARTAHFFAYLPCYSRVAVMTSSRSPGHTTRTANKRKMDMKQMG